MVSVDGISGDGVSLHHLQHVVETRGRYQRLEMTGLSSQVKPSAKGHHGVRHIRVKVLSCQRPCARPRLPILRRAMRFKRINAPSTYSDMHMLNHWVEKKSGADSVGGERCHYH
jgi:hypothetical protein